MRAVDRMCVYFAFYCRCFNIFFFKPNAGDIASDTVDNNKKESVETSSQFAAEKRAMLKASIEAQKKVLCSRILIAAILVDYYFKEGFN